MEGAKRLGVPVGSWLTAEQGKRLLLTADSASLRGKRDYATLLFRSKRACLARGSLITLAHCARITGSEVMRYDRLWSEAVKKSGS